MSNFLAVDTSSSYLTVAAKKGDREEIIHLGDCAMRHSVILMDEVERVMDKVSLSPKECDYFVAVTGPGSFTGIRIGISCVKGYAVALGKKAAGVTTFRLITYNVNSRSPYLVAIDAMHGHYYACGYSDGKEDIAPAYVSAERVKEIGRPVYGFEDLPIENYTKVDISSALVAAAKDCAGDEGLTALYVRRSQAEEERIKALSKNGKIN